MGMDGIHGMDGMTLIDSKEYASSGDAGAGPSKPSDESLILSGGSISPSSNEKDVTLRKLKRWV